MLAQTYHLVAASGDEQASMLLLDVDRRRLNLVSHRSTDFFPTPIHQAILEVESYLIPRFSDSVREGIWPQISYVLRRHGWKDVRVADDRERSPLGTVWRADLPKSRGACSRKECTRTTTQGRDATRTLLWPVIDMRGQRSV